MLITPQEVVATKALNEIGAVLREQGLSLEELIESGRESRDGLVRELYGIDPSTEPDSDLCRHQRPVRGLSDRGAVHAKRGIADQTLEIVLHRNDELIVFGDLHQ